MTAASAYARIDRASRVEGASPHRLIAVLFDELLATIATLRVDPSAHATKAKALSILSALEASLDHTRGGEVAAALGRVYAVTRAAIERVENDPKWCEFAREQIMPVAEAWRAIRPRDGASFR